MLLVLLKAARAWTLQPILELLGEVVRSDADRRRRQVVSIEIHESHLSADWSAPLTMRFRRDASGKWAMETMLIDVETTAKHMRHARQMGAAHLN